MKAALFLVILILIIILVCYYISSNNNQNRIKNKEKFKDNLDSNPDDPINFQIYSLSLNNTPYLTYVNTDPEKRSRNSLTINSHIRFPDSTYVPIKITPFCKFDTTQDQLLFYFLIDRIEDNKYNDYDPKVLEPNQSFNKSLRNLPLLTENKDAIYNYKIECDNQNVENQHIKLKTNNDFMFPYLIDPYEFSNDLNNYKLNDIDISYKLINNDNIDDIDNVTNRKLVIPKFINSDQNKSLNSLGISLFQFEVDSDDIDIIYKPSINYTEVYKTTSGIKSYHKINCLQLNIPIKNLKYLNLENLNQRLKYKFILQSTKEAGNKDLIYNLEKYPELIYNNQTSFNINKEIYNLNFYITDTEYHLIKDNSLQLIACLYSDINIGDNNILPRRLYYEHVTTFTLNNSPIIDRELNKNDKNRSNINREDTLSNSLKETYNVLPTYALNNQIETSPESLEGFKSLDKKNVGKKQLAISGDRSDIKKKLIINRFSNILNCAFSYGLSTVYYKDTDLSKRKYDRFMDECNVIKEYSENNKLLDGFIPIKFNTFERFQEEGDVSKPTNLYTSDNKLILEGVTSDPGKVFNTILGDYMYANTGNDNNTQHNSVRITQYTSSAKKELEYLYGNESHKLDGKSKKINLKHLGPEQLLGAYRNELKDLKELLNINEDETIDYQFNDQEQSYLYSNNLLFKAKATGDENTDGIYNKLIVPAEDTYFEINDNKDTPIPKGFKLNVYNRTDQYWRGRRKSKSRCDWDSWGKWVFMGLAIAALVIVTAGVGLSGAAFATTTSSTLVGASAYATTTSLLLTVKVAIVTSAVLGSIAITVPVALLTGNPEVDLEFNIAIENYVKSIGEKTKEENTIIMNNLGKIKSKIDLNLKNKAATTENFINIKSFMNISEDGDLIEHPFATEKNNGNKSFNEPSSMHVGNCTARSDLLTTRTFKDSSENLIKIKPMSVNGEIMGSINYYSRDHTDNYSQYQHASPAEKYVKIFTYMNDYTKNSYIDLSDADISINDFGGLNYYEIYKNYYKDGDNYINGVINMVDGPWGFSRNEFVANFMASLGASVYDRSIFYNTRSHGKGDLTPVFFIDDYNHISANHKYVEEYNLFYTTIVKPYNIKLYTKTYHKLLELLHSCGSNQILLTYKKPLLEDISDDTKFIAEASIKESIDEYMKDVTPPDSFKNTNNNNNKNKNTNNNKNKNTNNKKSKINKFQDTTDLDYNPVFQLGVLNKDNSFAVNIKNEDKILKSGNKVDNRGNKVLNIFSESKDTLEIDQVQGNKDKSDNENKMIEVIEEDTQYEVPFEFRFLTTNHKLISKFQKNSVIFEEDYYYIKLPVEYQGENFLIKDHKFYMTLELYEYPKPDYTFDINESNLADPSADLKNSRIGTSVYSLINWNKNDGYLKDGDIINFVVRIDKNVIKSQQEGRDTIECRPGGNKQFSENCRITLSDSNFAIIYLKNLDYKIKNDEYLGKIESFVYKSYSPFQIHQNEEYFLKQLGAHTNSSVKNRYIGRKVVNGITFNEESFFGLRNPNVPTLLPEDVKHGTINGGDQFDSELFFCPDNTKMAAFRVGYDAAGITGIQGICENNVRTVKFGEIREDGTNNKVIPIDSNKVIVGVRDLNVNYKKGNNDLYTERDVNNQKYKDTDTKPYLNKIGDSNNKEVLKNYIHELAPFEIEDKKVKINNSKKVGNEREVFYVNDRKILSCQNSLTQRIVGFTAGLGNDNKLSDLGFLCDNIETVPYITTTTTKPVSNDLKPKLKPYRIRDESLKYIGVDRSVNDNNEIIYSIIFAVDPPLEDHRFKFYITYFRNSDSLYYITSSKYLVEKGENVILTTANLKQKTNENTQLFTQLSYGEADINHAYQIKFVEDDDTQFNVKATFVLDLDKTYCNLHQRFSTMKFECTKKEEDATKFTFEALKEDLKRPKPTREVTQLEHELVGAPRDLDSKFGFNVNVLNNRINNRNIKLNYMQNISNSFFFK